MKCIKLLILLVTVESALAGGSSNCEPLGSNFLAFFQVFDTSLERNEKYATDSSLSNPIFTPAIINYIKCVKEIYLNIASNATSRLSNVDSDTIYNAFVDNVPLSSLQSLNCIDQELTFIKENFTQISTTLIPYLQSITEQSTANTATCFNVYSTLFSYFTTSISLLIQIGQIVAADTINFQSINMGDIYLGSMNQANKCFPTILSAGFGAILNADIELINAYVNGTSTTLPHPVNCVQSVIDFAKNIMNQSLNSFNTGTPLNLNIPAFPAFS